MLAESPDDDAELASFQDSLAAAPRNCCGLLSDNQRRLEALNLPFGLHF
jgi:hypothetical protein